MRQSGAFRQSRSKTKWPAEGGPLRATPEYSGLWSALGCRRVHVDCMTGIAGCAQALDRSREFGRVAGLAGVKGHSGRFLDLVVEAIEVLPDRWCRRGRQIGRRLGFRREKMREGGE